MPIEESLAAYLKKIRKHPLLSAEEEIALARKVIEGDAMARQKMIESNLRLVVNIAKRHQYRGVPLEDLISEGNIGLMTAVRKYEPDNGSRFSTYATYWIDQAIGRAVDNQANTIRLPIHIGLALRKIKRVKKELSESSDEEPDLEDIAEKSELPAKQVKKLLGVNIQTSSLDSTLADYDEPFMAFITDDAPLPQDVIEADQRARVLRGWLEHLRDNERLVMTMRFGLDGDDPKTLEEVGNVLGVTRERVRQIEAVAMKKLKALSKGRRLPETKPNLNKEEDGMARKKEDLTGRSCADCGKPAGSFKYFNVKYDRCNPCAIKYRAALAKKAWEQGGRAGDPPKTDPSPEPPKPEAPEVVVASDVAAAGAPDAVPAAVAAAPTTPQVAAPEPKKPIYEKLPSFISINFCPNCGQDLAFPRSLKRTLTYLGEKYKGGTGFGAPIRVVDHCNACQTVLHDGEEAINI